MGPIVRDATRGFKEARIVPESAERLSGRGRFSPRGRRSQPGCQPLDRKRRRDPSCPERGGAIEMPRIPGSRSPLGGSSPDEIGGSDRFQGSPPPAITRRPSGAFRVTSETGIACPAPAVFDSGLAIAGTGTDSAHHLNVADLA